MRTDSSATRYAARAVAAVLLVVLAAVSGVAMTVNASGASADPVDGVTTAAATEPTEGPTDGPTATGNESTTDGPTTDGPTTDGPTTDGPTTDGPTTDESPSQEPTTDEPTTSPTGPESTVREVDGAEFRWGINNQTNAHSHNPMPAAFNFMSAGVANPGRGGIHLPRKKWQATDGNVTIQKWDGKRWRQATWAGLNTSAKGQKINAGSIFSAHNVVIGKGHGTVDAVNRKAEIRWSGTFTVLYYGGNTMFTVTDPVLSVKDGQGVVTADLGGYASSRDGGGWAKVPAERVTIATLGKVDLTRTTGFTVTPKYLGVTANGTTTQDRSGKHFGAFPQQMISFLADMEIDQFWYSTGLSTDDTKLPLPLSVSFDDKSPVVPTPTGEPSDPAPTVDNPVNEEPPPPVSNDQSVPQVADVLAPVAPLPTAVPALVPESQRGLMTAADLGAVRPVAALTSTEAEPDRTWWLIGSLLFVAALLLLVPGVPRRGKS